MDNIKLIATLSLLSLVIVAFIVGICINCIPQGYLRPGSKTGGIHNMVLIYAEHDVDWNFSELLYYVLYLDKDLDAVDYFFDGFLIILIDTPYGRLYTERVGSKNASIKEDWDWLLHRYFGENQILDTLEDTVAYANSVLEGTMVGKVVLMIPYPDSSVHDFGEINGKKLDFSSDSDRLTAVKWFIDQCIVAWNSANFTNIELVGFYWMRETVTGSDISLVVEVNRYIHQKSYLSFWIPYYFAQGVSSWRELGFDCVALQPNYFFYFWAHYERVHEAAQRAKSLGIGIEMEIDENIIRNPDEYVPRYKKYLESAIKDGFAYGFMAYYQSFKTYKLLCLSTNQTLRELYDMTYHISRLNYL